MPALVACADAALARAAAQHLLIQCAALRDAGVHLLWLALGPAPGFPAVTDAAAMDAAWEREETPTAALGAPLSASPAEDQAAALPAWLAAQLAAGEFDRVLVLAAGAAFSPTETALARSLLAAGAEAVELLPLSGLGELSQSWISGRRATASLLA
ncbi:MAG: hypothetical protein ACRD2E_07825 [Terriglobales bacterium]